MKIYIKSSTVKTRDSVHYDLDLWGSSSDTNILYILGYSGSGKSTKAIELAKEYDADVIHLDLYFEGLRGPRSKSFDHYLEMHFPEYVEIYDSRDELSKSEWGKLLEKFESTLLEYGRYMYSKGIRVIAEGVQLMDDTLFPDKSYFKHVPTLLMSTNQFLSNLRGARRDNISPRNYLSNMKYNKQRKQQYKNLQNTLNN